MRRAILLLTVCLTGFTTAVQAQEPAAEIAWVQGGPFKLKVAIYKSIHLSTHPMLVVVLHGDAPFNKPDYQDTFARALAAADSDLVVAALLRPGYTDPAGHTSEGDRGLTTGDNYNARNTDAIAAAISGLRDRTQARRLVVVGHSGGAAITANILGRFPALIDAALLVSCPCDVTRWREVMFQKTGFDGFRGPVATLSPIDLVARISDKAVIQMIVGDKDDVTPPAISDGYKIAAVGAGKDVTLTRLEGRGHEILLAPVVLQAAAAMVASLAAGSSGP